jgi:hypothetical protein
LPPFVFHENASVSYKACKVKQATQKVIGSLELNDFFIRYSCSPIRKVSLETNRTAPLNVYPTDWNQKSIKYKNIVNWKCEKCNIDLSGHKRFLHTHHKNGNTYENGPSNLEALCIRCHANQHNHSHLRKNPDYKEYIKLF